MNGKSSTNIKLWCWKDDSIDRMEKMFLRLHIDRQSNQDEKRWRVARTKKSNRWINQSMKNTFGRLSIGADSIKNELLCTWKNCYCNVKAKARILKFTVHCIDIRGNFHLHTRIRLGVWFCSYSRIPQFTVHSYHNWGTFSGRQPKDTFKGIAFVGVYIEIINMYQSVRGFLGYSSW